MAFDTEQLGFLAYTQHNIAIYKHSRFQTLTRAIYLFLFSFPSSNERQKVQKKNKFANFACERRENQICFVAAFFGSKREPSWVESSRASPLLVTWNLSGLAWPWSAVVRLWTFRCLKNFFYLSGVGAGGRSLTNQTARLVWCCSVAAGSELTARVKTWNDKLKVCLPFNGSQFASFSAQSSARTLGRLFAINNKFSAAFFSASRWRFRLWKASRVGWRCRKATKTTNHRVSHESSWWNKKSTVNVIIIIIMLKSRSFLQLQRFASILNRSRAVVRVVQKHRAPHDTFL